MSENILSKSVLNVYPGSLDRASVREFHEEGFLAFRDFLSEVEIQDAGKVLARIIESYHSAALSGQTEFEIVHQVVCGRALYSIKRRDSSAQVQFEPGIIPVDARSPFRVRKVQSLSFCDQWFATTPFKSRIEAAVAQILSEEVVLYDEMALLKPPGGMESPLHQDSAYMTFHPPQSIVGVWIAIDPASRNNGCMRVFPKAHKLGPLRHSIGHKGYRNVAENPTSTVVVQDGIVDSLTIGVEHYVELPPGGILFFAGHLPHGSYCNNSLFQRRALQYHYHAKGIQSLSQEEYARINPGYFSYHPFLTG